MAKGSRQSVTLNSIFNGLAPSQYFAQDGQYLAGIGIDPELPLTDAVGDRLVSGQLRPSSYAKFSGANVSGNPLWLLLSPKTALLYAYMADGKLVSYDSSFANETLIGTPTSGAGNGAAYYNNYLYLATPTDVSRYGPLNGTAALANNYWTSTLSKTAMVNTTYPSIRGSGTLPNHPMHVHVDGALYIGDFDSTSSTAATRGKGIIHKIKTKYGSVEGDTDDGSAYNVLDLPVGYMPTCIKSFGNYIVAAASQTTNGTLVQGKAALFFWDTISDSFYNVVQVPDALVTAMAYVNGELFIFSGPVTTGTDVSNGYRLSRYIGGQSLQTVHYSDVGASPLAGAVESYGSRIAWGTFTQISTTTASAPEYYPVVMAYGSKSPSVPSGVHCIAKASASATAADGMVTALLVAEQASLSYPRMIIGWRNASGYGIDKSSTTYGTSVWRSRMVNVGQRAIIRRVRIPLGAAVAANMTVTPYILKDDFSASSTLTAINSTNYPASERTVRIEPDVYVNNSFCLELRWTGTALLPVKFPITVEFDLIED